MFLPLQGSCSLRVEVLVKRKEERENLARCQYTAVQGKVLKERYTADACFEHALHMSSHRCGLRPLPSPAQPKEKWELVKKNRRDNGLWYKDEMFPDDVSEETW